jgi:hypothetical protein
MIDRIIGYTLLMACLSIVTGFALIVIGAFVWRPVFDAIWPAAGWMMAIGILVGGIAGVGSLVDGRLRS